MPVGSDLAPVGGRTQRLAPGNRIGAGDVDTDGRVRARGRSEFGRRKFSVVPPARSLWRRVGSSRRRQNILPLGSILNTTLNAGGYHGLDRARDVALSESTRTSHCNSLHEKSRPSRTAKLVQWYSCGLKTRLALLRIGRTARTRKNVVLRKSRIVPALQGWFGEVPASRATTAGRGAYRVR